MTEPGFAWRDATVAIVGLGLMGGSLALALREKNACAKILAVDHDPLTRAQAESLGMHTSESLDLVSRADVIVLATPVRAILELLPRVGALAQPGACVLDLGSTKQAITRAMESLPPQLQVIGAHPMCGKETAGFAVADAHLFRGALFALTPLARTARQTLALAQTLAETVGAHSLVLDAARHDQIVATTSHLPYALAAMLMLLAADRAHEDDAVFALAAGGFRDTSRLAASDPTMMLDILLTNRVNVAKAIRDTARHLNQFADMLERGDENELRVILARAAQARQKIFQNGAVTPTNPSADQKLTMDNG